MALLGRWQAGNWGISKWSSFASALMPQTKCAIQQGFPNKPKAERVTVCLTEQELAVGSALLSVCHSGKPRGLPSSHSHRQCYDCVTYVSLKASPKRYIIIMSLTFKLHWWDDNFLFHLFIPWQPLETVCMTHPCENQWYGTISERTITSEIFLCWCSPRTRQPDHMVACLLALITTLEPHCCCPCVRLIHCDQSDLKRSPLAAGLI